MDAKKLANIQKYFFELGGEPCEDEKEFPAQETVGDSKWKLLGVIRHLRIEEIRFLKMVTLIREKIGDPTLVLKLRNSPKRKYHGIYILTY